MVDIPARRASAKNSADLTRERTASRGTRGGAACGSASEDAEARGLVALEYDQGRGNYKIRLKG